MQLYNIKDHSEKVSFAQAVRQGLGRHQGLFFPSEITPMDDIDGLLALPFVERSQKILRHLIGSDEMPGLEEAVASAFSFGAPPVVRISDQVSSLELFHGPTLAFKDFGARFMARCLEQIAGDRKITILTATSGDTGAAVAHAFFGLRNINVCVLYPKGKVSPLQEKLFCTLGGNIRTVAVRGTFDDCQALVKEAFDDEEVRTGIGLNSANSINISRLLAQVCYYFEAVAALPAEQRKSVVFSVPSGNFGDVTAGLIAKALGLRVKRFVISTNVNDTVPRYLKTRVWDPHETVPTLSNAMDVSRPNNWPRVEELFKVKGWDLGDLASGMRTDEETRAAMRKILADTKYVSEPHGAIAWSVLQDFLGKGDQGIFLETAAPAKFKSVVDEILGTDIELPEALASRANMPVLSDEMDPDWKELRAYLLRNEA